MKEKLDADKKREETEKPKLKKSSFEISQEALEQRRLLEAFLLDKKEELIKERNKRQKKFEEDVIELRGGQKISRLKIRKFVQSLPRIYSAVFPNENPFFTHMFRLHPRLAGHDPKEYYKPYLAGKLLKKLTYERFNTEFSQEVLSTLVVLAMPDGVRLFKCHEFLTPDGLIEFKRFRDEANEMMKDFKDGQWYDFMKEYSAKYKQVFQPRLF